MSLSASDLPVADDAGATLDVEVAVPDPVVWVEDLHVHFKTTLEHRSSIKELVASGFRNKRVRHVEALRGVSFYVERGEVYGVIGHNGAGKSTLFRVIAGIYKPTGGRVVVDGRVTPLLSIGLGFNRELTGRENILIGGLANGLDLDIIMERYDDIVRFADIGEAIDSPMRTYSSGMFARVGFAVAAFLDPEILLVDEALGAGDSTFKAKARDKIDQLVEGDTTILIITHGMELLREIGNRALWLERGQVRAEGGAQEIVEAYLGVQKSEDRALALDDI